jgi:hypothetical protein
LKWPLTFNKFYLSSQESVNYEHSLSLFLYCPRLFCHYHFCDVFFLVEANLCMCFACLYLAVGYRTIKKGKGWDSFNRLNTVTFVCLSQAMTWIYNDIYRGLSDIQWVQVNVWSSLYIFHSIDSFPLKKTHHKNENDKIS